MSDSSKLQGTNKHDGVLRTSEKESESTGYQYDAFISYSSRIDYGTARKVESFLESFHKTLASAGASIRPLHICRDGSDFKLPRKRPDIPTDRDDPIWNIIHAELSKCRHLIVLCSPPAVASTWMSKEISWFLEKRGSASILPVVTAGVDPIGKPEECFPAEVMAGNLHTARIWYDLRGINKQHGAEKVRDYEDEMVRLASDLLFWDTDTDSSLATIWEREQLKKRRRQARVGLIAAGVMIAISGVAFWQFESARQQATLARVNAATVAVSSSVQDPVIGALVLAEVAELTQRTEPPGGVRTAVRIATVPIAYSILRGHQRSVRSAAFSRDGRLVVTASEDGTMRVWRADGTGSPVVLRGHQGPVRSAVFSPDGRSVLTVSDDNTARVWRTDGTGSPVVLQGHQGLPVGRAAFSPDGQSVVTAS